MTSEKWTYVLVLFALAGGLTAPDVFADELLDSARSVRWTTISLQETPPTDLSVKLTHDAKAQRFADFVYGSPDSRRVAVVVAETEEGEFALYADRNRDRVIRERELVTGEGHLRMMSLAAEKVDGVFVKHFPRRVLLRWAGRQGDLNIATATRVERSVFPDGDETSQALRTRQIDGNANGLFADTKDWLQIDLNDDDRFDPLLETFPFRPLINAGGRRWFVKADSFGERLHLESASATGRVRITAHPHSDQDTIEELVLDATIEPAPRDDATRLLIQPRLFTGSGLLISSC